MCNLLFQVHIEWWKIYANPNYTLKMCSIYNYCEEIVFY